MGTSGRSMSCDDAARELEVYTPLCRAAVACCLGAQSPPGILTHMRSRRPTQSSLYKPPTPNSDAPVKTAPEPTTREVCELCRGRGKFGKGPCPSCNGTGFPMKIP